MPDPVGPLFNEENVCVASGIQGFDSVCLSHRRGSFCGVHPGLGGWHFPLVVALVVMAAGPSENGWEGCPEVRGANFTGTDEQDLQDEQRVRRGLSMTAAVVKHPAVIAS